MPKNKNAYLRYLIIHKEIKRNTYKTGYPTKQDILEELNDQGYGITGSQLEKDLSFLRNEKGAPLVYDAVQRCYRYEDDWEFDVPLGIDDVKIVRMAMHKLELFSQAPEFKMVKDSIDRLSDFFNLSGHDANDKTDKYILFEYSKGFTGKEWLSPIYDAIYDKKEITFTHCKFSCDKPTIRTLQPYILKEHRNRWYVIGKEKGKPRQFGLDRIQELTVSDRHFIQDTQFYDDIFRIFYDAVGVMAFDFEPEEVILHFNAEQADYVKSLMLHRSQVITPDIKGGGITVKMNVKITPEFITECILPYGNEVKVLAPSHLAVKVKNIYCEALENYNKK
ncbi:MAG TPA: WYL domain-containing protein [Bacteroidales bacterium]|nr:WYL domain-containing protein [Bacteroidales bacterium]